MVREKSRTPESPCNGFTEGSGNETKKKLKIAQLRFERQSKLLYRFSALFMIVVLLVCLRMLLEVVAMFYANEPIQFILSYYEVVFRFVTMSSGYIFAEFVRRSTVNECTDDLRPYTWGELYRKVLT